jgi:hypothetical protein
MVVHEIVIGVSPRPPPAVLSEESVHNGGRVESVSLLQIDRPAINNEGSRPKSTYPLLVMGKLLDPIFLNRKIKVLIAPSHWPATDAGTTIRRADDGAGGAMAAIEGNAQEPVEYAIPPLSSSGVPAVLPAHL